MLDYLETGLFRGHPDAASPHRRRRSPGGPAAGIRGLLADGRVLVAAAVVAVALAILAGTSVPLRSTQAGPGRPSVTPSPVSPSRASQSPETNATPSPARPSVTPSASPSARSTAAQDVAGSNGAVRRQATAAATAGMAAGASPAASAPATRRVAQATALPAVVVTFTVTSRGNGIFEGEIRIVNNGARSLANWQVSVALPGDRVIAVANASGFAIHGILLLQPASGATPVPSRGGVLNIFFVAAGPQPVSGACTYNQSPCG